MTSHSYQRGGAPVGFVHELPALEAATVHYFRLWCSGVVQRQEVQQDFQSMLGKEQGDKAVETLRDLFQLCCSHGRRQIMYHTVSCKCLGADEACIANFIAAAGEGATEDALLIAILLVRPDYAPSLANLARDLALAFRRMSLAHPRHHQVRPYRANVTGNQMVH